MSEVFIFTVNSIMPIVLIMVAGYILKMTGFFSKEFLKYGNKTVFYVCLPVMLFKNIADIDDLSQIRMDVVLYTVIVIAVIWLMGLILAKTVPDRKQKGVVHQVVFRSNFALIGVPLAELMCGSEGVKCAAVISLFSIPIFNVLAVIVLSVYKNDGAKNDVKKILKDIVTNPLILGILLGFIYAIIKNAFKDIFVDSFFSRLTFLKTSIDYISRSATPLALLVLGGQFDFNRIKGMKRQLITGLIGRNLIAPLIGVGIAAFLTLSGKIDFGRDVFAALISLFATPVAVASAIMAEAMDNDGQLAGQFVVWSTLVSVLSLFITIFLVRAAGLL